MLLQLCCERYKYILVLLVNIASGAGVNIHFTSPLGGEMDMLNAAGFGYTRMDFQWAEYVLLSDIRVTFLLALSESREATIGPITTLL